MIIKSLTLDNFQLFKTQEIHFEKLNILQGINHDSENDSGNGSGKSTILSAIQFLLYGEVSGINLKDLISFGKEESFVEGIIEDKGDIIRICRTIPTDLKIFVNETEVQGNTNAIKQQWLNNRFGDSNYFKTYRTIDSSKGINLLDQGTTTLRKTLMAFVDTEFSKIRTSLLAKKLERETYNVSKRPYSHYLSTKRKCLLENGLKERIDTTEKDKKNAEYQCKVIEILEVEKARLDTEIGTKEGTLEAIIESNKNNDVLINGYNLKLDNLKNIEIKDPEVDNILIQTKEEIQSDENDLKSEEENLQNLKKQINNIEKEIITNETESKKINEEILRLEKELLHLNGYICDKCNQKIQKEDAEKFIKIAENKHLSSSKRIYDLDQSNQSLKEKLANNEIKINDINDSIDFYKNAISSGREAIENLNKEKEDYLKAIAEQSENNKWKELIVTKQNEKSSNETYIEDYKKQIEELKKTDVYDTKLKIEKDILEQYQNIVINSERKEKRTQLLYSKYNEAFKFANYKYTAADVAAYAEAVKVLDGFSGHFINQWLDSLSFIINDLLRPLNMEVIFSPDKEFIKVKDNGQELKYEQCSQGQKVFLGAIFKLGILLHRGDTSGIILVDEGFGSLDEINLKKFVDILKSLTFQTFLIYQNSPEDFQDVNYLTIERKNGESHVA